MPGLHHPARAAAGPLAGLRRALAAALLALPLLFGPAPAAEAQTAPAKPTGLTATAGNRVVTLRWTNPNNSDITGWQYRQGTGDPLSWGSWTNFAGSFTDATLTRVITGLTNGTEYSFEIRAVAGTVEGTASDPVSGTPIRPPARPTGLTATTGDASGEVDLNWTDPGDDTITSYDYRIRSGSAWNTFPIPGSDADTTSHTVTGLTDGTEYTFQIFAKAGSVFSPSSASATATPMAPPPAKPTGLTAAPGPGSGQVTLRWTDPGDSRITRWQWDNWRGTPGAWGGWRNMGGAAGRTSFTRGGFDNGTQYGWRIRACAGSACGAASDAATATPAAYPPPLKPAGLTATPGDGEVTLSWDDPKDSRITHWQWRYRASGGSWPPVWSQLPAATVPDFIFISSGLTNGTAYEFQIRAVAVSLPGALSDIVSATPRTPPPAKPTGLAAEAGDRLVRLSWDDPSNSAITKYQYRRGTGDPVTWGEWTDSPNSRADTTSIILSGGLANGTEYSFQIRAVAGTLTGAASDTVSATPMAPSAQFTSSVGATPENISASIPISINPAPSAGLTVAYTVTGTATRGSDGDFTAAASDSVAVSAGTTGAFIPISIVQDALREGDETVILTLADGAGYDLGARTTHTLTIEDDDPPLAPAGFAAAAGDGQVVLSWDDPSDAAISGYQFRQRTPPDTGSWGSWTAIASSTAATTTHTVTGLTNGTAYGFQVRALDGTLEGAASSEATATPAAATPGVAAAQPTDQAVTEGDASDTATFTVALRTRPSDNVAVTVTAPAGLELAGPGGGAFGGSALLAFLASTWNSAQTVTMRATDDSTDSPLGRELSVAYSTSSRDGSYRNLSGTAATVTVADNDPTTVALAGAAGDVAEGGTKDFTVTLGRGLVSGEALPVPLTFGGAATRGTDYTTACPTTLPTGVTCANLDSGNAMVTFTGPSTGTTADSVTLTLSATTDSTAESGGETVVIGLGTLDASSGTGLGGGASGADNLADFRIVDAPTVAFASGSTAVTVAEGDDSHAELTLELSAARGAATQVRLISTDGTATAGSDFAGGPYTVDFPAGDTSAELRIAIEDENVPEEREEFSVTIVAQDLPAGVSVGAPKEATVTIRDDDQPHPAPTGLTATPGAGSVALAWRYAPPAAPAVDRTADFQYRRGTGDPVSWGAWTTIPNSGAGTRSHTVRGLAGGTDYAFQVRARSRPATGFRPGLESATARATPLAGLADKVRGWAAESPCAAQDACVAHWKRALKALGQTGSDLADVEPMTFGEALTLAYTPARLLGYTPAAAHGARWLEVAKALQALEVERVVVTIAASPPGPVAEGAEVEFTLTAAAAASTTFDLFVTVADATGGGDFLAAADEGQRRVRLAAGATSASFTVATRDDGADEPDGAVTATVNALPSVYTVGSPASASVQVTDNDGEGTVAPAAPADFTAAAGDARVVLRWTKPSGNRITGYEVRRRTPPGTGTWGDWTPIADSDADTVAHTVADLANGTAYGFEVRALAGALAGAASSEASATPSAGAPPPVPGVSIAAGPGVSEGAGATFTLTAAPPPAAPLAVSVAVSQGGDFAASGQIGARTVTVPTSGTATFAVRTVDDTRDEPDGTVTAAVSAGTGYTVGSTASATVAVADNDAAPATCPATAAGLIDTVRRYYEQNRNNPARNFGENWRRVLIAFGAKPAGTPDAAPFTAAEARAGEAVWDGWRPVRVELERLEACPGWTPPRVPETTPQTPQTPPSTPRVAVAAGAGVTEGTAAAFTLTATPAPAADLTVNYTVSDAANADFVAADGEGAKTAVIRAGESSADIEVATVADSADEPSGSVSVAVDSGDGYAPGDPASAEVRVADDDATTVALAGPAGDIAEDGGTKAFTVTLGRTLEAHESLRVPLVFGGAAARGADWTAACAPAPGVYCGPLHTYVSPHVEFVGASGAPAVATVTLAAVPDSLDEGAGETVTVAIGTVETNADGGAAASGSLSFAIADDDDPPPAVTVAAGAGVAEGADAVFTITVTPAPASALAVNYAVADADGADFLAAGDEGAKTLTIAAGSATATVAVPTVQDTTDEPDGEVALRLAAGAGYRLGDPPSAAVRVSDDDGAASLPGLSISDARGGEGEPMRFTITLSPASEKTVRVRMDVRDATPPSARWEHYDYARPYYDVTFAPGETEQRRWVYIYDDAHDEGEETFEAVLSRAEGAVITKAVGVGTITNSDPLPAAYLARFGRTVAEQALEGIAGRLSAERTPGMQGTLAGRALTFDPAPSVPDDDDAALAEIAREFGAAGSDPLGDRFGAGAFDTSSPSPSTLSAEEALLGSRFTLTGPADATGGTAAFWGRASRSTFDGTERGDGTAITLDGTVTTALLGADYARGDWLFGLALTQSTSDGSYASTGDNPCSTTNAPTPVRCDGAVRAGDGDLDAQLTAAIPYAALDATPRLKLWGAAGRGAGEVTLKTLDRRYRADTEWTMAAAGLRGTVLTPPPEGAGPELALTADALWTRTASDRTRDLLASRSDVTRLRLGVEGRYRLAFDGESQLTPTLEAGVRHDGGDAETGLGLELGGGLAWSAPTLGLSLDLSGRTLIAHDDDDFTDRGLAAALTFDPRPESARGPSLSLRQDVGDRAEGGLDALFAPDPLADRTESDAAARWTLEGAWGFSALGGRFTASPHAALGLSPDTRETTLGWRLTPAAPAAPDLTFGVKATRREEDTEPPAHTVGVEATVRW